MPASMCNLTSSMASRSFKSASLANARTVYSCPHAKCETRCREQNGYQEAS